MSIKTYIITGHYGSGKTNFSVNLALKLARENPKSKITVCDLDIVNPYFRTADFTEMLAERNIGLFAPKYANTNLDIPAIDFDMSAEIQGCDYFIADIGGDDTGAVALGRYSEVIGACSQTVEMLYVVNMYRCLTRTSDEALELMREIETTGKMVHSAVVNNSNLGCETDGERIKASLKFAEEICDKAKLPLYATACPKKIEVDLPKKFPVEIYVKPVWNV